MRKGNLQVCLFYFCRLNIYNTLKCVLFVYGSRLDIPHKLCILLIGWSRSVQPILSRAAEEVLTYEALR